MTSPAVSRGLRKATRTLVQTIAGGALTGLVAVLAGGLAPATAALVLAFWTALVAFIQNWLEARGTIPAVLPSPGLVTTTAGGALGTVVGTVDTVVAPATATVEGVTDAEVVGDVLDTTGRVVGSVTGAIGGLT